MQLRAQAEGSDDLLLRGLSEEEALALRYPGATLNTRAASARSVYRYRPGAMTVDELPFAVWETATGRVVTCSSGGGSVGPFELNGKTDVLTYRGSVVSTAGKVVLAMSAPEQGELVAVYSAEGPRGFGLPGLMLGKGQPVGRQFHQVFAKADGKSRGTPVILPFVEQVVSEGPCWSADGNYVVYVVTYSGDLCILRTTSSDEQGP